MCRPEARRRGAALGATLGVMALVIVVSFTLSAICFSHLQLANRWHATQRARNAAESAVSLAFARIVANVETGKSRDAADDVEVTTADGCQAWVTFSPDTARERQIPWSTNNLAVTVGTPGWNRTVPTNAVHLVGTCTVDGTTASVEAVMHIPPFPYAIASSGLVKSDSGLVVAKVSGAVDARTFDRIPRDRLLPAHVVSNSRALRALMIGPQSRVTGDVQASGGISLSEDSQVLGQVRPNADPVVIPRLDVEAEVNDLLNRSDLQSLAPGGPTEAVRGVARCDGSMTMGGDLVLDGATVYVDGDLTVQGGIVGKGAVYVTGKTTIKGTSDLAADSLTALLSKGDVVMSGLGKTESSYRGLIYTEGSFTARDVTLIGAFVANGRQKDTPGDMSLDNVTLLQDQAATGIKVKLDPPPVTIDPYDLQLDLCFEANGQMFTGMTWPGVDPVPNGVHVPIHIGGTPPNIRVTLLSKYGRGSNAGVPLSQEMSADQAMEEIRSVVAATLGNRFSPDTWAAGSATMAAMRSYLDNRVPTRPRGPGGSGSDGPVLDLDLNRFLTPGDALRLLLWRVL